MKFIFSRRIQGQLINAWVQTMLIMHPKEKQQQLSLVNASLLSNIFCTHFIQTSKQHRNPMFLQLHSTFNANGKLASFVGKHWESVEKNSGVVRTMAHLLYAVFPSSVLLPKHSMCTQWHLNGFFLLFSLENAKWILHTCASLLSDTFSSHFMQINQPYERKQIATGMFKKLTRNLFHITNIESNTNCTSDLTLDNGNPKLYLLLLRKLWFCLLLFLYISY